MRRRPRTEEDYDFLKENGMLGKHCVCDDEFGPEGCPIHDPFYPHRELKRIRDQKKDPKTES